MCPPVIHFLVKIVNFKLLYFFQFSVDYTKRHIFAKFGMENLFTDPVFNVFQCQKCKVVSKKSYMVPRYKRLSK